jgi:hypothetical protein
LGAWLAFVAVLALSLLPTLSHALAHTQSRGDGGWAEVCTPQGPQRIAVDAAGKLADTVVNSPSGDAAMAAAQQPHCPMCALAADLPMVPLARPSVLPPAPSGDGPPAAFLHAPRSLHLWLGAQPRAPPVFS